MKSKIVIACVAALVGVCIGLLAGCMIWGGAGSVFAHDVTCLDGVSPDANGCCAGETYTDMGDMGFNCCPSDETLDCFPPTK